MDTEGMARIVRRLEEIAAQTEAFFIVLGTIAEILVALHTSGIAQNRPILNFSPPESRFKYDTVPTWSGADLSDALLYSASASIAHVGATVSDPANRQRRDSGIGVIDS
jgi:hypothetical protein